MNPLLFTDAMTATFDEQQYHYTRRTVRLKQLHHLLETQVWAGGGAGKMCDENQWIRCVKYINTVEQDQRARKPLALKWEGWVPWNVELALRDALCATSLLVTHGKSTRTSHHHPLTVLAADLRRWAGYVTGLRATAKRVMLEKQRARALAKPSKTA